MKELAIGETGVINGVKVKCLEGKSQCGRNCASCQFYEKSLLWCWDANCSPAARADKKFVVYQAVTE